MPSYSWRCLACDIENAPADESCSRCGCPASPTHEQIASAKKSAGIIDPVDGPSLKELVDDISSYLGGNRDERSIFTKVLYETVAYGIGICALLVVLKACEFLGW